MAVGVIMFAAWVFFMAITTGAFIFWGFHEGQFKDMEEPKYRMMIDREPETWPGRKPNPLVRNREQPSEDKGGEHGR